MNGKSLQIVPDDDITKRKRNRLSPQSRRINADCPDGSSIPRMSRKIHRTQLRFSGSDQDLMKRTVFMHSRFTLRCPVTMKHGS